MRVGIVGAGFAGLAAAIAFHRDGHDVTVFEKAREPRGASAGIALARNALACLDILGVRDHVSTAWSAQPYTVRNDRGDVLIRSTLAGLAGGTEFAVVKRSELLDLLASRFPADSLRRDVTVAGVTEGGHLEVDGGRHLFDLVVGADGAHRVVRKALWRNDARLHRTGVRGWSWIVDASPDDTYGSIWGRTADFGIMPLNDGRTYIYGGARPGHADLSAYRGWPDPLPRLIAAATPESINLVELTELRPPRRLVRGRVVLIGDAAHAMRPTFGQGAATAMEDAITLAFDGVAAYERRRARMAALYWMSRLGSRLSSPGSNTVAAMRDSALRMMPDPLFELAAGSVSRWRPPTAAAR